MGHCSEIFVGVDVAKARNAIAVADGERGSEVRFIGEVDASEESLLELDGSGHRLHRAGKLDDSANAGELDQATVSAREDGIKAGRPG